MAKSYETTEMTEYTFTGEGEQHSNICNSLGIILDPNTRRAFGKLPLKMLTNGVMMEISSEMRKLACQMPARLATFNIVKNNFELNNNDFDDNIWKRVHVTVDRVSKRFFNLVRLSDRDSFHAEVFELPPPYFKGQGREVVGPQSRASATASASHDISDIKEANDLVLGLKKKVSFVHETKREVKNLGDNIEQLKREREELRLKIFEAEKEIKSLRDKLMKSADRQSQFSVRNFNKKIKRKDTKIDYLQAKCEEHLRVAQEVKHQNAEFKTEKDKLEQNIDSLRQKIESLRIENRNTVKRFSYRKRKDEELPDKMTYLNDEISYWQAQSVKTEELENKVR